MGTLLYLLSYDFGWSCQIFFGIFFLLLFSIGLPRQSLQNLQPCRPFFAVKATAGGWHHRHPTSLCTMTGIAKLCPKILLYCCVYMGLFFCKYESISKAKDLIWYKWKHILIKSVNKISKVWTKLNQQNWLIRISVDEWL